jgi:hypothetical protein
MRKTGLFITCLFPFGQVTSIAKSSPIGNCAARKMASGKSKAVAVEEAQSHGYEFGGPYVYLPIL